MKKQFRRIYSLLTMFGIDPRKTLRSLKGLPSFFRDFRALKAQTPPESTDFQLGNFHPCLEDRFAESGSTKGHYFHQDLLVARRVFLNHPNTHVDIGSRVDGVVAHIASYRKIEVLDIRPLSDSIPNIRFIQADLMASLSGKFVNYCDSLSSLHALEHFGLGGYGAPINYQGFMLGLNNLHRILKGGGKLYISLPGCIFGCGIFEMTKQSDLLST